MYYSRAVSSTIFIWQTLHSKSGRLLAQKYSRAYCSNMTKYASNLSFLINGLLNKWLRASAVHTRIAIECILRFPHFHVTRISCALRYTHNSAVSLHRGNICESREQRLIYLKLINVFRLNAVCFYRYAC